jgi:hypothetical protein
MVSAAFDLYFSDLVQSMERNTPTRNDKVTVFVIADNAKSPTLALVKFALDILNDETDASEEDPFSSCGECEDPFLDSSLPSLNEFIESRWETLMSKNVNSLQLPCVPKRKEQESNKEGKDTKSHEKSNRSSKSQPRIQTPRRSSKTIARAPEALKRLPYLYDSSTSIDPFQRRASGIVQEAVASVSKILVPPPSSRTNSYPVSPGKRTSIPYPPTPSPGSGTPSRSYRKKPLKVDNIDNFRGKCKQSLNLVF